MQGALQGRELEVPWWGSLALRIAAPQTVLFQDEPRPHQKLKPQGFHLPSRR